MVDNQTSADIRALFQPEYRHGTHVTGTIAAIDNSIDSVGVAAGHVEIYSRKSLGKSGGSLDDLAWSIMHATDGPDGILKTADDTEVIAMSLGGDISSSPSTIAMLQDAIDYSTSNGVTDLSGISMATPHVAAVIALLMTNGLSTTQAQNRIVATALDMGYPSTLQGAGLMLADAAI